MLIIYDILTCKQYLRYKQIVAKRLATSGANIAYNLNTPTNGPFPTSFTQPDSTTLDIMFDKDLIYR